MPEFCVIRQDPQEHNTTALPPCRVLRACTSPNFGLIERELLKTCATMVEAEAWVEAHGNRIVEESAKIVDKYAAAVWLREECRKVAQDDQRSSHVPLGPP